jgi:hypothetical protein
LLKTFSSIFFLKATKSVAFKKILRVGVMVAGTHRLATHPLKLNSLMPNHSAASGSDIKPADLSVFFI